jgi:hypothetical protein
MKFQWLEKFDTFPYHKKELKKFSITMFVALGVIGTMLFFKTKGTYLWFYLSAAVFLLWGILAVESLRPIYIFWMRLAFVLSWINTRLILVAVFYLIFTPMGFLMRLFKGDLLDRKIDKKRDTYWIKKEKVDFEPSNYERQF